MTSKTSPPGFQPTSVRGWRYLADFLERVRAIAPADLQRVARHYLVRERRTVLHLLPEAA